jgi:DNA-damage-inducible protein J
MIHVRLDEQVKADASAALEAMGLSISDAVRALLVRVAAEKALPFALRVPNATTRAAMAEADEMVRAGQARFAKGADLIEPLDTTGGQEARDPAASLGSHQGVLQRLGAVGAVRTV